MSVILPGSAEANVSKADASPCKECSQTREGNKPVESSDTAGRKRHERQRSERNDRDGREKRTTGTINVAEEPRRVTLLCHRSQCARATVDTRQTDGNDREEDDRIDKVTESRDAGVDSGDDEWGGADIDEAAVANESLVVPRHKETDKEECQDVEKGDAPEDLLDCARESLLRVLGLGGRQTYELRTREGERGRDEDAAEAGEAGECAGVVPCSSAPVVGVSTR